MAVLEGLVLAAVLLVLLLAVRVVAVVKSGSRHRPGTKGSVSVLVVAGSGNVSDVRSRPRSVTSSDVLKTSCCLRQDLMTSTIYDALWRIFFITSHSAVDVCYGPNS